MPGGIYDQNPVMLERFMYILNEQEKQRKKEEKERERREMGGRKPNRKMSSKGHY